MHHISVHLLSITDQLLHLYYALLFRMSDICVCVYFTALSLLKVIKNINILELIIKRYLVTITKVLSKIFAINLDNLTCLITFLRYVPLIYLNY